MADDPFRAALRRQQAGDLAGARGLYQEVLQQDPANTQAWNNLGILLNQQGQFEPAVRALREATGRDPSSAVFATNLGNVCRRAGRWDEAADAYRQALNAEPGALSALLGLGEVYREAGDLECALHTNRLILRLYPTATQAFNNLGLVYLKLGELVLAEQCVRRCLAMGGESEGPQENLATILKESARFDEALAQFDLILRSRPDSISARWNRSLLLLLTGRYAEGWKEYETRFLGGVTSSRRPELTVPEWAGEPLEGKTILVYCEQGLGDTLQFVRFLPALVARGARVLLICQSELITLLTAMPGVEVFPGTAGLPSYDVHLALMSLPRVLGITLENLPATVPYLPVPAGEMVPREAAGKGMRRVGLVWRGNPKHKNDRARSLPLAWMLEHLGVPGVELCSLQYGPDAATEVPLLASHGVVPFPDSIRDLAGTARYLASIDRVVTVDTSVAHLAGALGRPVWVLLPFVPDWRWLLAREESPWYPTARIFRQDGPNGWKPLLAEVGRRLQDEARPARPKGRARKARSTGP